MNVIRILTFLLAALAFAIACANYGDRSNRLDIPCAPATQQPGGVLVNYR